MLPLFSVIIPVYNCEEYLAECVGSVLKQGFKNLEIVLIDDCSTDKSSQICASFARQNKTIKLIQHKKNSGVSASRNAGIYAASGKYIIFLDSDDYLLEGSLRGLAKLIEEKMQPDVIIGKYKRQHENRSLQEPPFDTALINNAEPDDVIAYINGLSDFLCTCWRLVINRNFIVRNNIYFSNAKIYEDQDYVARLLCLSKKFAFYDRYFYWNRARVGSLSLSVDYNSTASCLGVADEMCKFIKNNHLSDSKKEFLYSRIKFVLRLFYTYLCVLSRKEIHRLSKIVEKKAKNFKILENTSHGIGTYFFNRTRGVYSRLLSYRRFAAKETASLVKNKKHKELYIFCAGLFARVTARILQNEGYSVKGFLDNNKALEGSTVLGLNVSTPSIFFDKLKDDLSDIFVIVCHQKKQVFDGISSQLREIGLKKEQIAHNNCKYLCRQKSAALYYRDKESRFQRLNHQ